MADNSSEPNSVNVGKEYVFPLFMALFVGCMSWLGAYLGIGHQERLWERQFEASSQAKVIDQRIDVLKEFASVSARSGFIRTRQIELSGATSFVKLCQKQLEEGRVDTGCSKKNVDEMIETLRSVMVDSNEYNQNISSVLTLASVLFCEKTRKLLRKVNSVEVKKDEDSEQKYFQEILNAMMKEITCDVPNFGIVK